MVFMVLSFIIYLITCYIIDVNYEYRPAPFGAGPGYDFASNSAAEVAAAYTAPARIAVTKRAPKEPCRVGSPFIRHPGLGVTGERQREQGRRPNGPHC